MYINLQQLQRATQVYILHWVTLRFLTEFFPPLRQYCGLYYYFLFLWNKFAKVETILIIMVIRQSKNFKNIHNAHFISIEWKCHDFFPWNLQKQWVYRSFYYSLFVNQKMGSGTFNSVFISLALVTVFLSTLVTAYLYVFPLFSTVLLLSFF